MTIFGGEACHGDDPVDVGLSKVLEFFVAVRGDNGARHGAVVVLFIIIIIIDFIVVAAAVTIVPGSGGRQKQRRIGFIDGVNGDGDPLSGVEDDEFGHVVFFVKNRTPHLSVEFFSSDRARRFAEKPSARGRKTAGES